MLLEARKKKWFRSSLSKSLVEAKKDTSIKKRFDYLIKKVKLSKKAFTKADE